jgi:hypothetical protein
MKVKRRPTRGSAIEVDRDAIELILKIKIAFEDLNEQMIN